MQLQREVDIRRLPVHSSVVEALAYVDLEGSFAQGRRGRIYVVVALGGANDGRAACEMLFVI